MSLLLFAGLLVGLGCGSKPSSKGTGSTNGVISAPLDYLAAQGRAKQHVTKVVSTVKLEAAIRQFQAMEDRWPTGFDELVKHRYLLGVPEAPRGRRFTYDPQTGQVGVVAE